MTTSKKGKNQGLGRGLAELLGNVEIEPSSESRESEGTKKTVENKIDEKNVILFLGINDIKPNPKQPRKIFSEEKILELAESIEKHGVIQPLVVKKAEKGYEIIAGERRWRAARKADLKEVPCILKELTEEENMVISIIENMQREDLNPIEEAEAVGEMASRFGFTQEEIAKSVGKSRPYITNLLRLLKLPEGIRKYIMEDKITAGHGRGILGLKDEEQQIKLAERVIKEDLSVRDVENIVKFLNENTGKPRKTKKIKDPNLISVQKELSEKLGTKVNLKENKGRGKLEIEFYSREELDGLIEFLMTNK